MLLQVKKKKSRSLNSWPKLELEKLTEPVLAAIVGGGLSTAIARFFIMKALTDLKEMVTRVNQVHTALSVIEVKLGHLEKLSETTIAHDRKITEIESRLKYEQREQRSTRPFTSLDTARMQET